MLLIHTLNRELAAHTLRSHPSVTPPSLLFALLFSCVRRELSGRYSVALGGFSALLCATASDSLFVPLAPSVPRPPLFPPFPLAYPPPPPLPSLSFILLPRCKPTALRPSPALTHPVHSLPLCLASRKKGRFRLMRWYMARLDYPPR